MIPWLEGQEAFPALETALREPNGLLCAGADLSAPRLLDAYQRGVFPWYSSGEPILWWSPDPRMVLFPGEFRVSRSLRRSLRSGRFTVKLDSDFPAVTEACAGAPRAGQDGTWITREMQRAYWELFQQGFAHSVETWRDGKLVGGLYGLAMAACSMANRCSRASLMPPRLPQRISPAFLKKRGSA
jgi:leucyl/phenylalanyl-tRNA--protein transferase